MEPGRSKGGWSLSPHRSRGRGVGSSSLMDGERRKGGLVPLPSRAPEEGKGGVSSSSLTESEVGVSASFSPYRHREGLNVPLTSQTPRVVGSMSLCPHSPRWWGGGLGVPLPSRTPGEGLGVPLLSRRPGPCPGGCPHRVPHEALEAEALLLGRAPGDDERLRLLAGPGRPRCRGRRHVPALAAPRPRDVTARDAGGPVMAGAVRARQRREFSEGPRCEGPREGPRAGPSASTEPRNRVREGRATPRKHL